MVVRSAILVWSSSCWLMEQKWMDLNLHAHGYTPIYAHSCPQRTYRCGQVAYYGTGSACDWYFEGRAHTYIQPVMDNMNFFECFAVSCMADAGNDAEICTVFSLAHQVHVQRSPSWFSCRWWCGDGDDMDAFETAIACHFVQGVTSGAYYIIIFCIFCPKRVADTLWLQRRGGMRSWLVCVAMDKAILLHYWLLLFNSLFQCNGNLCVWLCLI